MRTTVLGFTGGNAVLERLGQLLVDELKGKTFFEVSHHRDWTCRARQRFQRRPVFRGDGAPDSDMSITRQVILVPSSSVRGRSGCAG